MRRLNCGVMWPDLKESRSVELAPSLALEDASFTRRNAWNRSLIAGGERRCIVQGVSNIGFGELGRVFVYRGANAGRSYGRAVFEPLKS